MSGADCFVVGESRNPICSLCVGVSRSATSEEIDEETAETLMDAAV